MNTNVSTGTGTGRELFHVGRFQLVAAAKDFFSVSRESGFQRAFIDRVALPGLRKFISDIKYGSPSICLQC
jgi:hypothetical protein